jgi:hypothetical protein
VKDEVRAHSAVETFIRMKAKECIVHDRKHAHRIGSDLICYEERKRVEVNKERER